MLNCTYEGEKFFTIAGEGWDDGDILNEEYQRSLVYITPELAMELEHEFNGERSIMLAVYENLNKQYHLDQLSSEAEHSMHKVSEILDLYDVNILVVGDEYVE